MTSRASGRRPASYPTWRVEHPNTFEPGLGSLQQYFTTPNNDVVSAWFQETHAARLSTDTYDPRPSMGSRWSCGSSDEYQPHQPYEPPPVADSPVYPRRASIGDRIRGSLRFGPKSPRTSTSTAADSSRQPELLRQPQPGDAEEDLRGDNREGGHRKVATSLFSGAARFFKRAFRGRKKM